MYFYWAKYPQPVNFYYSPIIMEDQYWMISMYKISEDGVSKDLLQMFDSYPDLLWVSIIGSLVLFTVILGIGRNLLEKKKQILEPIWIVSMFTLDQDYLDESNSFLFVFSTFLSFACFFITQYLLNNMGTDLVVVQDPQVLGSYEDVINRPDATPLFLQNWPDSKEFENAPRDSPERKLWDHAENVSAAENRTGGPFTPLGPSLFGFGKELINQKVTLILSKVIASVITRLTASGLMVTGMGNDRFLLSRNKEKSGKTVAFLGMPDIEQDFALASYRITQRLIEIGIIQKMISSVVDNAVPPTTTLVQNIGWTIERSEKGDPDEKVKIKFENVHLTFRMVSILYAVGIVILLIEMIYKKSEMIISKKNDVLFKPSNHYEDQFARRVPLRPMAHRKNAMFRVARMQREIQNFKF